MISQRTPAVLDNFTPALESCTWSVAISYHMLASYSINKGSG